MSDPNDHAEPAPQADPTPNPAQKAYGRYRTRLAGFPEPDSPWGHAGWQAAPPSAMAFGRPQKPEPKTPDPMGSLTERLGDTVKLSLDLLNATLFSAANALSGLGERERGGCDCGCDDDRDRRHEGCCGCERGCGCHEERDWGHHCQPHVGRCGCGC